MKLSILTCLLEMNSPADVLSRSLRMVLNEEGYKDSTPRLAETLSMVKEVMAWCQDKAYKELYCLYSGW